MNPISATIQVALCPSVELWLNDAGDLYILPAVAADQLVVRAPLGEPLYARLQALSDGAALPALPDSPPAGVQPDRDAIIVRTLYELVHKSILRPVDQLQRTQLHDRQQRYFSQCGIDSMNAQHDLASATVMLLGVGGVGGAAAELLVRHGVSNLICVDHDVVDIENLPRQTLYTPADIGIEKLRAARKRLQSIAPDTNIRCADIHIESASDLLPLLRASDVTIVISTIDTPAGFITDWVDEACFTASVPWISGSQRAPNVTVGPLVVPGSTSCRRCIVDGSEAGVNDELRTARLASDFVVPAIGTADHLAAAMLVQDTVAYISGINRPVTLGRKLDFDITSFTSTFSNQRRFDSRWSCDRCDGIDELSAAA